MAARSMPRRCALVAVLLFTLPAGLAAAAAAADAVPAPPPAGTLGAVEVLIAVNTVCPIDGDKIDPLIAPIPARTRGGKLVGIGVCSQHCAELVRKDPQGYVEDAVANHRHRPRLP